jgi:hypothetical protein
VSRRPDPPVSLRIPVNCGLSVRGPRRRAGTT